MYTYENFKTAKALRQAVKSGKLVEVFHPGLGFPVRDGEGVIEGPHFPESHRFYVRVIVKNNVIEKVLK